MANLEELTQEQKEYLKSLSAYTLPDNPSSKGFNASQIKKKMYEPSMQLFQWLKETRDGVNTNLGLLNQAILDAINECKNDATTKDNALSLRIDDNDNDIEDLQNADIDIGQDITALDGRVSTNETAIGNRYTKTQVDQLLSNKQGTLTAGGGIKIENGTISATTGFHILKVTTLPQTGDTQTIYLKLYENDLDETDDDVYEEYIWVDNAWERLGKIQVDLSNYPTFDELDDYIEEYVGAADMIIYEQVPAGTTTQKFRMLTIDGDKWEIDSYSRSEIDDRVQAIDDKIDEIDEKMEDLEDLEERLNGYYTNLTNGESEEF